MEETRKVKLDWSAEGIAGMIFLFVGTIFVILAAALRNLHGVGPVFLLIYGLFGGLFVVIGGGLTALWYRKHTLQQKVYDSGDYFTCPVTKVMVNPAVRVNQSCLQYAVAEVRDPVTGAVHIYRSRSLRYCPECIVGSLVKIYRDRENPKIYYMDIDEIIPKMIFH